MDHISLLLFYVFHFKKEHQTELQTDEQHQIKTKNTGTTTADTLVENYRTRRPRDRRESVCWTWLGHLFFILIFNNYVDIRNDSIYKRIKVLTKFACKLPFIFYLYSLLQFLTSERKSHFVQGKRPLLKPPLP